jgi:hypothetical protein
MPDWLKMFKNLTASLVQMTQDIKHPVAILVIGILKHWFPSSRDALKIKTLPIAMGWSIIISKANEGCGIFGLGEHCNRLLGMVDNIIITSRDNQPG